MEPLTTQTFSGDRIEPEPAESAAEAALATAVESTGDDALAVPFRDFAISDEICRGLEAAGIFNTFPIQALTLPLALRGQDIIGQARTGTGKTLAFGIPLLQMVEDGPSGLPRALVVVPTRELAIQVADDLRIAAVNLRTRVLTVYGGRAYEPQIDALQAGVDIVVGTPGRLLDLVERRHLNLGSVQALVLDEADKMLDLGFLPDVERIVRRTPDDRQTMLFSATMPGDVVTLARRHMRRPTNIRAEGQGAPAPPPNTRQHVFRAHQMDKIEVLARVLQARDRGLTMVFCQTKRAADQVAGALETRGFAVATVHGDLGQGQRERALRAFRSGKVDVLTATEVAARGLDVDDVTHVVNYECPDDDMTYVHRIGRTGRAGRAGVAVTFVDWRDMHRWKQINDALNLGKPEPEETYSTSEHLYAQLDIPREATGTLPRAMRAREGLQAEVLEDIGETGKIRSAAGSRPARDSAPGGSGRSGGSGSKRGQARGGSGQPRKSSAAPAREDGGQAAGGATRARRRRRTRGGRDLGPGQQATGSADAGQASTGQASTGQASAGPQQDGAPGKQLGRRRRSGARAANQSEETQKAS
ncbi:MAG: DEAD/DEAH box helicase [Actinomycetota bacterium]|nr:DEAD/DEAH box helicase [Actinomycetota bacterium]